MVAMETTSFAGNALRSWSSLFVEVLAHPHLDKQIQRISTRRTVGAEADGHAVLMHQ